MEEIEIPTHDNQIEWLKNAFICYLKENKTLAHITLEMEELKIEGLGMSIFDSISCVVSKLKGSENMQLDDTTLYKLKVYFESIIP